MESWLTSSVEDRESFSSPDDMGARKFPQAALMKLMILYTSDGFLRESLEFPKGSQATCSYEEDRGMVIEPMQGNSASPQFDLGHTNLFCVPEVKSGFFKFVTVLLGTL